MLMSQHHQFNPKLGWNSVDDNIVECFYKPALRNCRQYDRMAGYFDSSAFAVVMREILDFVERGGKMRLGTGVQLAQADIETMKKSVEGELIDKTIEILNDDLGKKCLAVLAHMLSTKIDGNPQLEIKLFVPKNGGTYHPKTGIFTMDSGDVVSFSGSVNETGAGWARNVEEFKVFCYWKDRDAVDHDVDTFQRFWECRHYGLDTYDLPTAVKQNILKARPESDVEYRKILDELRRKLYDKGRTTDGGKQDGFSLYDYQKDAIEAWRSRGYRGILEMPTAVGKTFTALGCINKLQREKNRLFTVVAVPYTHLASQWMDNIRNWNGMVSDNMKISSNLLDVASGGKWVERLADTVGDFNRTDMHGGHLVDDYIVCTTYNKLADSKFIKAVDGLDGDVLLVADEAHNSGSGMRRKGLTESYSFRLALTATPERYFDEEGSQLIRLYFNDVAYFMEIGNAIRQGYLTPYDYRPEFVELSSQEVEEYRRLTRLIAQRKQNSGKTSNDDDDSSELGPENKRAKLVSKAEQKYAKLEEILNAHTTDMNHALIYCQDKYQIEPTEKILHSKHIFYTKITSATEMIERKAKMKSLEEGKHDCIVSMRCLDEGVDLPSARLGIIMASTGNRLQYIQRRGRFLRLHDDKDHAVIYDILASAPPEEDNEPFARKLVAKELLRHKEFAQYARNREEALNAIRPVASRLGLDLDALDMDYILGL